jgi:crotonobetainyl-CoA:carnitine CoA-transferase CaiB-like acyl-CoA transferase
MVMALEGLKVLDLARYAPGLYVSMYLGDMGADVIRIEEPGLSGRRASFKEKPLSYRKMEDERGVAFNAMERNKRRMVLNLKNADGREVFYKLVKDADVLLEGFRPGVTQRLGVDYETCSALNPRLIYCSLTGYGQEGPYRLTAGHDINYISVAGALGIIGGAAGEPVFPANLLADFASGSQNTIIGTLTALLARERTGRGQYVDISMTDGVIALMVMLTQEYFNNGRVPKSGTEQLTGSKPYYNVYQTKDGRWIGIGAMEPWFFSNVCKHLGRPDLVELQEDASRLEEIRGAFRDGFKTKTAQEWHDLMSQDDTCVAKIYNFDEVFSDPQVLHRQMAMELDHPSVGKVRQVGFPVKLSDTPAAFRAFAGSKGQHTDEILLELGYEKEDVARLREQGAVM